MSASIDLTAPTMLPLMRSVQGYAFNSTAVVGGSAITSLTEV
jgi:hypothetical protein